MGNGVVDHGQVLVQAGAQCLVDVGVVRLGDQADVICSSVHQGLHLRVGCSFAAHLAGGTEGDQPGVGQTQFISGAREELGVGRVGAGPATFDEGDPQLVQMAGDAQFVVHRQVDALLLRTVAQRGVVDVELLRHYRHCWHPRTSEGRMCAARACATKTIVTDQGLSVELVSSIGRRRARQTLGGLSRRAASNPWCRRFVRTGCRAGARAAGSCGWPCPRRSHTRVPRASASGSG